MHIKNTDPLKLMLYCTGTLQQTALAMQSSVYWDLEEEISTKFQMKNNYSTENMTASPLQRRQMEADTNLLEFIVVACGVAGTMTNILVMTGFCLAGKSKMNVNSVLIANHTTLELPAVSSLFFSTFVLE